MLMCNRITDAPLFMFILTTTTAVVGVNTSPDYVNPSGVLSVVDLATKSIVANITLPGQPDAVSVSPKSAAFPLYIALAIENERDEDLGEGILPQMPPGYVAIVTIADEEALASPETWEATVVTLAGDEKIAAACRFPEDPEPEYVAIHPDNTKVVLSMQENNCNAVIDLATGTILGAFDAGSVDLDGVDTIEEGLILQDEVLSAVFREPDGVSWIGDTIYFATANEGDMDGGSRGWSIVDSTNGDVVYDSGVSMEWETARLGHYPDERSGNKGNEPENVYYSVLGDHEYVFVLSERSSLVFVYILKSPTEPELVQILPVGIGPEGITTIPSKNLVAIASEVDERDSKLRSSIALFELVEGATPQYPMLVSAHRNGDSGPFIPFGALSGLASDPNMANIMYTVEDSFYKKNRILTIDTSSFPSVITTEQFISDSDGVLAECLANTEADLASMINDDGSVNIDPEGIAVSATSGFWVASEGKATPEYPNLLLKTTTDAVITACVLLPDDGSFQEAQKHGFEGVAEDGDKVVVAVQRAWGEDPHPRLAVYDSAMDMWQYAFYPLDEPESQYGGWVGLSDISSLGDGKFLVLERDNQGGPDAVIKKVYQVDLGDYSWEDGTVVEKVLVQDLMEALSATNGQIIEKVEGLAVGSDGSIWINSDNDGVDDSSGESILMVVGSYSIDSTGEESTGDITGEESTSDSAVEESSSGISLGGFGQSIGWASAVAFLAAILIAL